MLKIGIIGAGTVGSALAIKLAKSGYTITVVSSRTYASAEKLAKAIKGCKAAETNQTPADSAFRAFQEELSGLVEQPATTVARASRSTSTTL